MKKRYIQLLFSFTVPALCFFTGCNSLPDNSVKPTITFNQKQVEKTFKVDSLFIFNKERGYVVDFSGIHTSSLCSLSAEGYVVVDSQKDSIYRRITCVGDTILRINDSSYGLAQFRKDDVIGWDSLFSYTKDTSNLIGTFIAESLNATELSVIQSSQSLSQLTDVQKTSVINALNKIINNERFYAKYKAELELDIFFNNYLSSMYIEVRELVARSIFVDTLGTVKSSLSVYEKETVKWFNRRLFTYYLDNEAMALDHGKLFNRYSSAGRVYTMLFQQGPTVQSLSEDETIRFFIVRNSGMDQLAFQDKDGFQMASDNKLFDKPFMCDTSWTVSPLYRKPLILDSISNNVSSLFLPGKAVMRFTDFAVDFDSTWSYEMKIFYPLAGTGVINGKPVRIAGTINMALGFYKTSIYDTPIDQGYFADWNTEIGIHAVGVDNSLFVYKEKFALISDDSPLKGKHVSHY